jgi:hypothetical protein
MDEKRIEKWGAAEMRQRGRIENYGETGSIVQ